MHETTSTPGATTLGASDLQSAAPSYATLARERAWLEENMATRPFCGSPPPTGPRGSCPATGSNQARHCPRRRWARRLLLSEPPEHDAEILLVTVNPQGEIEDSDSLKQGPVHRGEELGRRVTPSRNGRTGQESLRGDSESLLGLWSPRDRPGCMRCDSTRCSRARVCHEPSEGVEEDVQSDRPLEGPERSVTRPPTYPTTTPFPFRPCFHNAGMFIASWPQSFWYGPSWLRSLKGATKLNSGVPTGLDHLVQFERRATIRVDGPHHDLEPEEITRAGRFAHVAPIAERRPDSTVISWDEAAASRSESDSSRLRRKEESLEGTQLCEPIANDLIHELGVTRSGDTRRARGGKKPVRHPYFGGQGHRFASES